MSIKLEYLDQEITKVQKSLIDVLSAQNALQPDLRLDDLINGIIAKTSLLSSSTDISTALQEEGATINGVNLNAVYGAIFNDIHLLYGTNAYIDEAIDAYRTLTENRTNLLESTITSQENRIDSFKLLKDRPWNVEAFKIDFKKNSGSLRDRAVYNKNNRSLSLKSNSSVDVLDSPEISLTILGSPERKVLPNYQISKIFDRNRLTAWYELVGFKQSPRGILDIQSNTPTVVSNIEVLEEVTAGSTLLKVNTETLKVNQYISIGGLFSPNHESVRILEVREDYVTLSTGLRYTHFASESIYEGSNLTQNNGAVAILELTFPYPQKVNFIRMLPFASRPLRVLGILVPSDGESPGLDWEPVAGIEAGFLKIGDVFSIPQVVSNKFRFVVEQPYGERVTTSESPSDTVSSSVWDLIYENEFNTRLDSLDETIDKLSDEEVLSANEDNNRGFL